MLSIEGRVSLVGGGRRSGRGEHIHSKQSRKNRDTVNSPTKRLQSLLNSRRFIRSIQYDVVQLLLCPEALIGHDGEAVQNPMSLGPI